MPTTIKGAIDLRKALRNYAPDLSKEMPKEIASFLKPVVKAARGYLPTDNEILSGWRNRPNAQGKFPMYIAKVAKAGITYKTTPSKPNRQGFSSIATILNKSAAGAIYETAGRKNSDSTFVRNLNGKVTGMMKGKDKMQGRAMFRSFEEDQGKATIGVRKAIEKVNKKFKEATQ
jgi:hypothetical protein